MNNLLQAAEWSIQKFVGAGLQVYGLATSRPDTDAWLRFRNNHLSNFL